MSKEHKAENSQSNTERAKGFFEIKSLIVGHTFIRADRIVGYQKRNNGEVVLYEEGLPEDNGYSLQNYDDLGLLAKDIDMVRKEL